MSDERRESGEDRKEDWDLWKEKLDFSRRVNRIEEDEIYERKKWREFRRK